MDENLNKLNSFFKDDLLIKNLIHNSFPNPADRYDFLGNISYAKKLENNLDKIEIIIMRLIKTYVGTFYISYIEVLFSYYQKMIRDCDMDYQKLENIFNKIFVNMSPELINKVNEGILGYYAQLDIVSILSNAKSISEILHVLHSYVVNNEGLLQSCNLISQKDETMLYGISTPIAKNIYDSLDDYFSDSPKIILSLNETHIIIMLRDFGHATTLDINIENGEAWIDYFIPKVCNYLMVNELPGIRKVDEKSKWAKGTLRIKVNELGAYINNFIKKIPTDDDMFVKGGAMYGWTSTPIGEIFMQQFNTPKSTEDQKRK